jgi:antitoxin component of RelBE/YafQ-DinJ toxin-antitoxin module
MSCTVQQQEDAMDGMVTGRMPQGKKEIGNAVLARLGSSASAAINQLYDYLIEYGRLPFSESARLDKDEVANRIALVDSIPLPAGNRFTTMTDEEIRRERLGIA